jgi:putative flippase GtrA
MLTFIKAQAVSLTATIVDYLTTILFVALLHQWYVTGNIAGMFAGGITYFLLGRFWVFKAQDNNVLPQAARYLLVWTGYLMLSVSLVFLITQYAGVNYIISKICVSIVLAAGYNYVLQRFFVFKS